MLCGPLGRTARAGGAALYRHDREGGGSPVGYGAPGARTYLAVEPQMATNIMLPRGFPNTPPWPEPLHGGATIGLKNELPYLGVWHPPLKVIPADVITAL